MISVQDVPHTRLDRARPILDEFCGRYGLTLTFDVAAAGDADAETLGDYVARELANGKLNCHAIGERIDAQRREACRFRYGLLIAVDCRAVDPFETPSCPEEPGIYGGATPHGVAFLRRHTGYVGAHELCHLLAEELENCDSTACLMDYRVPETLNLCPHCERLIRCVASGHSGDSG